MNKIPNNRETIKQTKQRVFERLGQSLYWKGDKIVARVRVNGKPTWRSTGTDNPAEARKWLQKWQSEEWMEANGFEAKGVVLHRQRVTAGELIDEYLAAGCPTKKMQQKSPATIRNEQFFLNPTTVLRVSNGFTEFQHDLQIKETIGNKGV